MTLKKIWTLNFLTSATLLIYICGRFLLSADVKDSDKNIIIVYLIAFGVIYLVFLSSLFYFRIYNWKNRSRVLFYLASSVIAILSLMILYFLKDLFQSEISIGLVALLIVCILNLITFFWGLMSKEVINTNS